MTFVLFFDFTSLRNGKYNSDLFLVLFFLKFSIFFSVSCFLLLSSTWFINIDIVFEKSLNILVVDFKVFIWLSEFISSFFSVLNDAFNRFLINSFALEYESFCISWSFIFIWLYIFSFAEFWLIISLFLFCFSFITDINYWYIFF